MALSNLSRQLVHKTLPNPRSCPLPNGYCLNTNPEQMGLALVRLIRLILVLYFSQSHGSDSNGLSLLLIVNLACINFSNVRSPVPEGFAYVCQRQTHILYY